jgi:predicted enzyme related to lactoylglutathione lyase
MITRKEYPAGVPCWVELSGADPEVATAFYGGILDWTFEQRVPGIEYRVAKVDGKVVAGIDSTAPTDTATWLMYVAVDDADAAAAKVRQAGGQVLEGPSETPGVGRSVRCADPAGAVFCLWQSLGVAGAELVNAPGSWVFNSLDTPDPERAKAFYGDVFGWRAVTTGAGSEDLIMWTRPGYGDFLASIDPEIRRRHEAMEVPDDFTDAIGWMTPSTDGPAAWGTQLSVADDPDLTVERAVKLGGSVLVPPTEAPPVRYAVIADPQGAVLNVSLYKPNG